MTTVLIFHDGGIETYYQQTMEYLNQQYYNHPTSLVPIPLSSAELGEMSFYESMGNQFVASGNSACAPPNRPSQIRQEAFVQHDNGYDKPGRLQRMWRI